MKQYDVIVVGGGHAGTEAAWIAASMGSSVALVTLKISGIGVMSCNPAIGGLGKGHLVREIDALGGLMGRAADAAGIQFRLLNRTKGPAVQGLRAQSDRLLYQRFVGNALAGLPNLDIIEGEAIDLLIDGHAVAGVILADSSEIRAKSVILTTGTFLRGVIHIGDQSHAGGRVGDAASVAMAQRLDDMDLPLGRLKTGTPPRLNGKTIDWSVIEMQPGDDEPSFFSFMTRGVEARQIACGITHTNSKTHDIIRDNLAKSAMYGGHIDGVGPRYCPSIEDKIVRFADKESHQIFLEPEGLTTDTIYPNGISTSLPVAVQVDYVRSIRGLEQVEIEQPGYAIEYDYVDPRALRSSLELKSCPGLFLAGQINGTTGYEEAAAQGAVAAINAVRSAQGAETVLFSRKDSYIGVMVDDLVTRGVAEPYRMFTSRAEFRLMLRADNADQRLTPLGRELGIVTDERWRKFSDKAAAIEETTRRLGGMMFTARDISSRGAKLNVDGAARSGLDALALADFGWSDLVALVPSCADVAQEIGTQVKNDALYAHYIRRQEKDVEALAKDEALVIPTDLCFDGIAGLSTELKVKLSKMRPENIAQARRIDGMTPAALLIIIGQIRQFPVKKAAR